MSIKSPSKTIVGTKQKVKTAVMQPNSVFTKFVGKINVKPLEQPRLSLGTFNNTNNPAKGFLIELNADPNLADSTVTEITTLGTSKHYELILQVANYGSKTVSAKVWQM